MTTFVLVHGSWHRSSCWERVTPILLAAGHRVSTVNLPAGIPTATMEDYVESVQAAISSPAIPCWWLIHHLASSGLSSPNGFECMNWCSLRPSCHGRHDCSRRSVQRAYPAR
jgi:hypothetical protein